MADGNYRDDEERTKIILNLTEDPEWIEAVKLLNKIQKKYGFPTEAEALDWVTNEMAKHLQEEKEKK